MKTAILEAEIAFVEQPFKAPLVLSSGAITELTEARAKVVALVDGKEAVGRGSIYLSDLWAWPDSKLTHDQKDAALRTVCAKTARDLPRICGEPAHPLELGMRLHESVSETDGIPVLAGCMCVSPFDAAIHDAVGAALGVSAFDIYSPSDTFPSVDGFFADGSASSAIVRLIRKPKKRLPAWLIVGKNDSIHGDIAPWIKDRGYRCFKLKLMGKDNERDVDRTIEVFRGAKSLGVASPQLSVDTNEGNPDADSVLDYLLRLKSADAEAFAAVQYLEQPTARDILAHPCDWRKTRELKPVLLDEGLTSLELLDEAVAQGWSGFALKTCKGHSFALVAAAWAHEKGLLLSLQDLTNPGLAMIHAALFGARAPTINGAELNSPQFTPAANEPWLPRLNGLFQPHDGCHHLPDCAVVGLGSTL